MPMSANALRGGTCSSAMTRPASFRRTIAAGRSRDGINGGDRPGEHADAAIR
jgi:hypothetical protein